MKCRRPAVSLSTSSVPVFCGLNNLKQMLVDRRHASSYYLNTGALPHTCNCSIGSCAWKVSGTTNQGPDTTSMCTTSNLQQWWLLPAPPLPQTRQSKAQVCKGILSATGNFCRQRSYKKRGVADRRIRFSSRSTFTQVIGDTHSHSAPMCSYTSVSQGHPKIGDLSAH